MTDWIGRPGPHQAAVCDRFGIPSASLNPQLVAAAGLWAIRTLRLPAMFAGLYTLGGLAYGAFGIFVLNRWDVKFGDQWGNLTFLVQALPVVAMLVTLPVAAICVVYWRATWYASWPQLARIATAAVVVSLAGGTLASHGVVTVVEKTGPLWIWLAPGAVVLLGVRRLADRAKKS